MVLDLGSGLLKVRASSGRVDNGQPHLLSVRHQGLSGVVQLDSAEKHYFVSGSEEERLQLEGGLVVGGRAPFHRLDRFPPEFWSVRLSTGYFGCLENLTLNQQPVQLMKVALDQEVTGLSGSCGGGGHRCRPYPCLHGGVCREGWNRFICDCSATAFTGSTCRIGEQLGSRVIRRISDPSSTSVGSRGSFSGTLNGLHNKILTPSSQRRNSPDYASL